MKKLLLSLLTVAGIASVASAQTNEVKFGVKAGVTFPTWSVTGSDSDGDAKSNTSFYIGGTADIPLGEMFTVQPGLLLIGKGVKQKDSFSEEGYFYTGTFKRSLMYIEVPVNLVANFAVGEGKIFIGAGPYYGIAISGNDKVMATVKADGTTTNTDTKQKVKFGKTNEDADEEGIKRGDFGVNFLAGYQLSSGINIHAGYGLGLSNLSYRDAKEAKATNRVFSVGVGFSF